MVQEQFYLRYGDILNGQFSEGDLNLALVFQVNCPGCFMHAIPLANQLGSKYADRLKILGISTAFEDFDFNTEANTKKLVENGTLVGETAAAMKRMGIDRLPDLFSFPVAMDQSLDEKEKKIFLERVPVLHRDHMQSLRWVSSTFWLNNLNGTPSWILYDNEKNLINRWFGHLDEASIDAAIRSAEN